WTRWKPGVTVGEKGTRLLRRGIVSPAHDLVDLSGKKKTAHAADRRCRGYRGRGGWQSGEISESDGSLPREVYRPGSRVRRWEPLDIKMQCCGVTTTRVCCGHRDVERSDVSRYASDVSVGWIDG